MANSTDWNNKWPFPFATPFASRGDRYLPLEAENPNVVNLPQGWNNSFEKKPINGGNLITRPSFNGILGVLSDNQKMQQVGVLPTFDPDFAAKIGGYPKGAVLWNIPRVYNEDFLGNTFIEASASSWCGIAHNYAVPTVVTRYPVALVSTIDNNTSNFVTDQRFITNDTAAGPWVMLNYSDIIEKGFVSDPGDNSFAAVYQKSMATIRSESYRPQSIPMAQFTAVAGVLSTLTAVINYADRSGLAIASLLSPIASKRELSGEIFLPMSRRYSVLHTQAMFDAKYGTLFAVNEAPINIRLSIINGRLKPTDIAFIEAASPGSLYSVIALRAEMKTQEPLSV